MTFDAIKEAKELLGRNTSEAGIPNDDEDEKFSSLEEARNSLELQMQRVREVFPDLLIEEKLAFEFNNRRRCINKDSLCYKGVAKQLVLDILRNRNNYRSNKCALIDSNLRNAVQESESLTAITVSLPIAEKALNLNAVRMFDRRIKLENTYEFYELIISEMQNAMAVNVASLGFRPTHLEKLNWGANQGRFLCDCAHFLEYQFPRVRSEAIKQFFMGVGGHRILPVMIGCFCIQHNLLLRPEFKKLCELLQTRKKVTGETWEKLCKHLEDHYVQDRLRRFRKTEWKEANDIIPIFDGFLSKLRVKFPYFFDKNGSFNEKKLYNFDPGKLFECYNCCESFPKRYSVKCRPIERISNQATGFADEKDDTGHRICMICLRHRAEEAETKTGILALDGAGVVCIGSKCDNTIPIKGLMKYLPRTLRRNLHEKMISILLNATTMDDLEKCPKCGIAVVMDCPKDENRVFACLNPKCDYQHCRSCFVDWNDHFGIKCNDIPMMTRVNNLRVKIDERLIRKCARCGIPFLKAEACNKISCACGLKSCYLCGKTEIDYDHFCKCNQADVCTCGRECKLWGNSKKWDEAIIASVKKEADPQVVAELEKFEKDPGIRVQSRRPSQIYTTI